MKRIILLSAAFAVSLAIGIIASCNSAEGNTEKKPDTQHKLALIKRGEYLVNSIGCDDCHSPKRMGSNGPEVIPELRFSGYPSDRPIQSADPNAIKKGWVLFGPDLTSSVGPWGMSFSANLTSDATGIGNWKEAQFIKAIREGRLKGIDGNRPMLPPMPWIVYKNLNDDDLKAIFAYLQTTKPVNNVVPAPRTLASLK